MLNRSFFGAAAFHYLTLFLFQLHRIWDLWRVRDLSWGDTSQYFYEAVLWHERFLNHIAWSPLYTMYWGTFMCFAEDPYIVAIAHRMVLTIGMAALILAVLRCFLPPVIAWLTAAWWCFLPVAFDTLYEVHLFSALPILVALLIVLRRPSAGGRAAAVGILSACTLLVRNEFAIIAGFFGGYCLLVDFIRPWRRGTAARSMVVYGISACCAASAVGLCFWRSYVPLHDLNLAFDAKHRLNVCQIYAYGYQQRDPSFRSSPWTECRPLMKREFGSELPSLYEAVAANPGAMMNHFWWNARLIPAGLEVLLVSRSGFDNSPEYWPIKVHKEAHLVAICAVLLLIGGAWRSVTTDHKVRLDVMKPFHSALVLAGATLLTGFAVSLMQRPRPSYLLACQVILLGVLAVCARIALWDRLASTAEHMFPVLACVLVLAVLPFYTRLQPPPGRRLLEIYEKLKPHRNLFAVGRVKLLSVEFPAELCAYLSRHRQSCEPVSHLYNNRSTEMEDISKLKQFLDERGVTLAYVSEWFLSGKAIKAWAKSPEQIGWKRLGMGAETEPSWVILVRVPQH